MQVSGITLYLCHMPKVLPREKAAAYLGPVPAKPLKKLAVYLDVILRSAVQKSAQQGILFKHTPAARALQLEQQLLRRLRLHLRRRKPRVNGHERVFLYYESIFLSLENILAYVSQPAQQTHEAEQRRPFGHRTILAQFGLQALFGPARP